MLNKNNRKLIVGSDKLFISNNILSQLNKDHDIALFSYDPNQSLIANTKTLYRDIKLHLNESKDKLVFMGYKKDCNLLYALAKDKSLFFDGAIFVNYEPMFGSTEFDFKTMDEVALNTKIYKYRTSKSLSVGEFIKTPFGSIRSKKLAQNIYASLVYDLYQENFLDGKPTAFVN